MDDDYQNPLPGKTYISPSLQAFGKKDRRILLHLKYYRLKMVMNMPKNATK